MFVETMYWRNKFHSMGIRVLILFQFPGFTCVEVFSGI